jgi:hypothetical protein
MVFLLVILLPQGGKIHMVKAAYTSYMDLAVKTYLNVKILAFKWIGSRRFTKQDFPDKIFPIRLRRILNI